MARPGAAPVWRARPTSEAGHAAVRQWSAAGLAQCGQYWREESLKDTSLIVSPHTGHGSPVRPCTRSPLFFSALSRPASMPCARATAPPRVVRSAS